MNLPKISVVILNWNTGALLKKFLPIVIENSENENVEIVLADNGSTDDSVQWVTQTFKQVRIIALPKNFGFAEGYNIALKQIDSDYSVLLNSDVAPAKNWLIPLLETMINFPETAACVPKIMSFNEPNKFEYAGACGGFIDRFGYTFCRGRIFNISETDNGQYNKPGKIFWGSGSALMIKTSLFLQTGGLDNDFFAHMEEIDWCWRVKNRGYDIRFVPDSAIYHLGGGTLSYKSPRKAYLNFRNNLLLIIKNKPGLSGWATLFFRFFLDYIAFIKFLTSGEFSFAIAIPKAHFAFLSRITCFVGKRKELMPLITTKKHPETYKGSIIVDFFLLKRKIFWQLKFNPKADK